jgi:hypothetical protein
VPVKTCIQCNQTLDVSEFHKDKKKLHGVGNTCKLCRSSNYQKKLKKVTAAVPMGAVEELAHSKPWVVSRDSGQRP